MKLPQIFILEKSYEDKIKELLEKREKITTYCIEEICNCYEEYMSQKFINGEIIPLEMTDKLKPNKEQITEFSRILPEYKRLKYFAYTNCFLSALMTSSIDNDFTLDLRGVSKDEQPTLDGGRLLDCVGTKLTNKTLEIIGNVGYFLGSNAKNCKISVYGNTAGDIGPDTVDCKIYITGAYGYLSSKMGERTKVYHLRNGLWNILPKPKH